MPPASVDNAPLIVRLRRRLFVHDEPGLRADPAPWEHPWEPQAARELARPGHARPSAPRPAADAAVEDERTVHA